MRLLRSLTNSTSRPPLAIQTRSHKAGALCFAVAALAIASPSAAATRYVFGVFKGDSAETEKLSIYTSTDGLNFTLLSNTGYSGPTAVLRDPSLMKHTDGQYYVAYTVYSWDTESTSFAIAKSPDLKQWTFLVSVPAQVTGVKHTWAPEWFKDRDGSIHLIVSVDSPEWDFKPYLYTATDDTLTKWSAPQPLGFGPNYIDTFVVTVGSTYHAFVKNETTKYIEHATASSLLGPWTFVGKDNWAGFGSGKEGPALFQLDNGSWRMFMDCYSGCGYLYTNSTDLTTWSAIATLPGGLSGTVRHGTVLREETGSGGTPSTGGASSTAGSSAVASGGRSTAGGSGATGGATQATGGTSSNGGTVTLGGTSAAGGTGAPGGNKATGGANATGGARTAPITAGGVNGSGGVASTGGRSNTGPAQNQGGTVATGGSATSFVTGTGGTSVGPASTRTENNTAGAGGDTARQSATKTPSSTGGTGVLVDASGVPVGTNATSNDSGSGCGCSMPGTRTHAHWLLAALAALSFIRPRRVARNRSRQ
jgi:hypothetical protein